MLERARRLRSERGRQGGGLLRAGRVRRGRRGAGWLTFPRRGSRSRAGRGPHPQLPHRLLRARDARALRRRRDRARPRGRGRRAAPPPGGQGPRRRTIAVVSTDEKAKVAGDAGADEVLRSDEPWRDRAKELSKAAWTWSSILSAATASPTACAPLANEGVAWWWASPAARSRGAGQPAAAQQRRRRRGRLGGLRAGQAEVNREIGAEIDRLAANGFVKPIVGARFPLERAADRSS